MERNKSTRCRDALSTAFSECKTQAQRSVEHQTGHTVKVPLVHDYIENNGKVAQLYINSSLVYKAVQTNSVLKG